MLGRRVFWLIAMIWLIPFLVGTVYLLPEIPYVELEKDVPGACDPYARGSKENCTRYACVRAVRDRGWTGTGAKGDFPSYLGYAGWWDNNATALGGFKTDKVPMGGSIAVWEANINAGASGHVGYVEYVNEDGSIYVTEYNNENEGEFGTRTIERSSLILMTFIYPPYPIVYEHANYAGRWTPLGAAITDGTNQFYNDLYAEDFRFPENAPMDMGDQISSIWVPNGWSVDLFKHANYAQPYLNHIDGPIDDLSQRQFNDDSEANDQVSSIKAYHWYCPGSSSGSLNASTLNINGVPTAMSWLETDSVNARSTGGICGTGASNPPPPYDPPTQQDTSNLWRVSYYNTEATTGNPVWTGSDGDGTIDHDWDGGSPVSGINQDRWSGRWEREINFPEAGEWKFHISSDDGFRLFIDGKILAEEWWEGWHDIAPTKYLAAGNHSIRLDYFEVAGDAQIHLWWEEPPIGEGEYHGQWYTEWFNWTDIDPNHLVSTSWEDQINYNWETGSPGHGLGSNHFSVRWGGEFYFPESGFYKFPIRSDDGFKLWVDDQLVGQEWWWEGGEHEMQPDRYLEAGNHRVVFEYFEQEGHAKAQLSWWKFPDDYDLPVGEVIEPLADTAISTDQIRICARLDDGDGIGIDRVQFFLYHPAQPDNWQYISEDSDGRDGYCATWDHSDWPDEEVNTHLFVWDRAGNMFSGGGNTFRIDRTPPVVEYVWPSEGAQITESTINVYVSNNDNFSSGVERIAFEAYYNAGNDNSGWWPLGIDAYDGDDWGFAWDISDLVPQTISFRVTSYDKAGNHITVQVDNISIVVPPQDYVRIEAVGTLNDQGDLTVVYPQGETIVMGINGANRLDQNLATTWSWQVTNPDGTRNETLSYDYLVDMPSGNSSWLLTEEAPTEEGNYTFTGVISWNGGQSEQTTTFTITPTLPVGNQIYLPIILK